ncbi:MAG: hypothetical protein ZNDK_0356 [Candidatus Desulfovibrio kirbyi]|jgi:hypothetical protein|uniref:Uncharacterized protein n=1 Tax=Candidatus Desulfovibrio kirbyi TaxID=2696086 RepID=A0A6L2R505_9BACT|nr:hypothetical protein [Desulfovibrio sp.]GFH62585.1 MAG: hypothetical protein ZNDK_0356 [Candidatus Desulfovibrio kirbyi]
MRYYMIDDLTEDDVQTLTASLKNSSLDSGIDTLFWLPVPREYLSKLQCEHLETCGPYIMGIELLPNALRLELLVRARGRLRCDCVRYAEKELQTYMMTWIDRCLTSLLIDA